MKLRIPLVAALVVAAFPLRASAQAWVSNPDFSEGIGIRTGNLELHPSLGGEFGYDSNYFRSSDSEGIVDVFRLRITPSLTLGTLSNKRRNATTPPAVDFVAGAHVSYNEIIAADSANSEASQRNASVGADAKLNVFPQGKVGFDLRGAYARTVEADGDINDLAGEGFNRGTVRGDAGVTWRPGGGLFEWRGGYGVSYNYFENATYETLGNLQHELNTRGRWRFLPKSALMYDAAYSFIRYSDERTQQTDGDAVRARVGFHGLVTYHLALMGMLGWASSFYEPRPGAVVPRQYDSIVATAEARWFLMPKPNLESATITSGLSSMALGYTRTFANSYYGSFYQRDRGYLQFSMFLLGAIAGGLEFGVSRVAYPDVDVGAVQQPSFAQLRIDGRVFGEYRFTDTLAANATVQYDQVSGEQVGVEDLDYERWQAFVGVRWFM